MEPFDTIYKGIGTRLQTFKNWPKAFISPEQLAEDGFVYTGNSDLVQCVFCKAEIEGWEEGDSLTKEHREQSPGCKLVLAIAENTRKEGIPIFVLITFLTSLMLLIWDNSF